MDYQNVFKRYEIKYLLNESQYKKITSVMRDYTCKEKFFKSTIRNVYYDTSNYYLIRRSLEKPVYKEKLRIRSYKTADADSEIFVELKKKYDDVVYKRRISLPCEQAENSLKKGLLDQNSQIANEINYFVNFYSGIRPAVYISYEREAYKAIDDSGFRITFDKNILYRTDNLTLRSEPYGASVMDNDLILMELKTSGAIPLWMVRVLTSEKIFKTSFSKYGSVYTQAQALFVTQEKQRKIVADSTKNIIKTGELIYV